ncbi:MAG: prephenate/arogenate dehydrogenase [Aphanocapsa sp. GSE-SYN-MK-11-07L]|jgi:arogenate dehydrogenase (NADP+)|nr:prephenate/arogenate dehydrogenase [Aphanocapsa sp. GSE-SYN-MK-11-07L]
MRIGIVGLGLIGGSLGLDLRSLGHEIFGVSRQPKTCEIALQRGVVDQASVDLLLLAKTEVIFVCTPLGAIQSTVEQLVPYLQPEVVLTDVGSVKAAIAQKILPFWGNFVPGHPMAGTAETGIEAAQSRLFAGKPYVLTPTDKTPPASVQVVADLVKSLSATLYQCSPAAHDRAVSLISHLPVMVSASLIATCLQEPDPETLLLAQQLASSGFRDTSRVGGGNPELGRMMAEYNQAEVLRSLHGYRQTLDRLIDSIETQNWSAIEQTLRQNQQARPQFLNPM